MMSYKDTSNFYTSEEDDIPAQNSKWLSVDLKLSFSLNIKKLNKKIFDKFLQVINKSDEIVRVNLPRNLDISHHIESEIITLHECYGKEKPNILGQKLFNRETTTIKFLCSWIQEVFKSLWLGVYVKDINDPKVTSTLDCLQNQLQEKMFSKQSGIFKKCIDLDSVYLRVACKDHALSLKECNKQVEKCAFGIDRHSTSDLKEIETQTSLLSQDFAYLIEVN